MDPSIKLKEFNGVQVYLFTTVIGSDLGLLLILGKNENYNLRIVSLE